MLLNEHQSKKLFHHAGIPVPDGIRIASGDLPDAVPEFGPPWIVKAQVLCGGRGKAGGIRRVDREDDLADTVREILSMRIRGQEVPFVRIEPLCPIAREFYLSVTASRFRRTHLLTVGAVGGMEIETHGQDNLLVQDLGPDCRLEERHARSAFFHLGLDHGLLPAFKELLQTLVRCVIRDGLLLAEINPLALTEQSTFLALDAKIEIDDNAVDIRPELARNYVPQHFSAQENEARAAGLSFVSLSGWVGLMGNGAGLAMATMDALNLAGLPAANFLDLGGGADQGRMETALHILFGDNRVEAVFINIFGGILSCEKVALALRAALAGRPPHKPVVVRMSGNRAAQGMAILIDMNMPGIHLVPNMAGALDILSSFRPHGPRLESEAAVLGRTADDARPSFPGLPFPLDENTSVLVQGITGREGRLHTELMLGYGTRVVAGVTPFKGGQSVLGVPVYDSVAQAVRSRHIDASIVFVPPAMAADAVLEAADAGIPWVVCITEGIPQSSMLHVLDRIKIGPTRLIGPNTPGLVVPGRTKIGIMPADPFRTGPVALLSRSGTLTYEAAARLSAAGIGQSLCLGIGGDPFVGSAFTDILPLLDRDPATRAVMILGEIGGTAEEDMARCVLQSGFSKPVLAFVAGRTAPAGRRLGHAGAILEREGGVKDKLHAMTVAGFTICPTLKSIPELTARVLGTEA